MSTEGSTDDLEHEERQQIWNEAREYTAHRAVIEQAKGMLMFVYGIEADAAFALMRVQSQQHNIKLRLVAEQIMKDLVELARVKGPTRQLAFDGLMQSAHRRITDVAARQLNGESKTGVPMKDLGPQRR